MVQSVTTVLVTYNSAGVISGALESLPSGTAAIVVDNASSDDSVALAEAAGATVIRQSENMGFGVGCNAGIFAATTPYVLLLNPDARLRAGALDVLVEAAERHPECWMLVPTLYRADGSRFEKWQSSICDKGFEPVETGDAGLRSISFASGAAILLRREEITKLGGFDPAIFLFFEDDDLSRRVNEAGSRIVHVAAAEADHAGGTSSPPSLQMTEMKHWHMAWSESYVRRKHGMLVWGGWKAMEGMVKMLWAQLRGKAPERAKQLGSINGTLAAIRGIKAQKVRANVNAGSEHVS
ncbi:MAG: glycosyltransferase family 2 protein [Beijerinckiaceae bacterium]